MVLCGWKVEGKRCSGGRKWSWSEKVTRQNAVLPCSFAKHKDVAVLRLYGGTASPAGKISGMRDPIYWIQTMRRSTVAIIV